MFMYIKSIKEDAPTKTKPKVMPNFQPKSWYSPNLLDARPMVWSLLNRPEEWRLDGGGTYLIHVPSGHYFFTSAENGYRPANLSNCGCSTVRGYQKFQVSSVRRAMEHWMRNGSSASTDQVQSNNSERPPSDLNTYFRSHFEW
jgi:hypothetical protein